jgi:hypothetical protein
VFAEEKYAGNQLAVIRKAADLSAEQMQRIANETHFSETTFILSDQPKTAGMTCASSPHIKRYRLQVIHTRHRLCYQKLHSRRQPHFTEA